MDDEQLTDADVGVKGKLRAGLVARAEDFDEEVRAALKMRLAVDGATIVEDDDQVRHPNVLEPVVMAVAHVTAGVAGPSDGLVDDRVERPQKVSDNSLMFDRRRRQDDVDAVPDFVLVVDPAFLPLADQQTRETAVENAGFLHPTPPGTSARSSTSRTVRASPSGVNGFCKNAAP